MDIFFPPPDARCHLYDRRRFQRVVRTGSPACKSKVPTHHTERGSSAGQPAEGHGLDTRRRVLDGGPGCEGSGGKLLRKQTKICRIDDIKHALQFPFWAKERTCATTEPVGRIGLIEFRNYLKDLGS
jgi:hypothetical protein